MCACQVFRWTFLKIQRAESGVRFPPWYPAAASNSRLLPGLPCRGGGIEGGPVQGRYQAAQSKSPCESPFLCVPHATLTPTDSWGG